MTDHRRFYTPGATWFFTVDLAERRGNRWLVENMDGLRTAFRSVTARKPYNMNAVVIMPDHLHCIWTVPLDDADFSMRWNPVKHGWVISAVDRPYSSYHKFVESGIYPAGWGHSREFGLNAGELCERCADWRRHILWPFI